MKILIFVIIPLPKILNHILWFSVFRQIVSFQSRQKALYTNVIYFGRQTQKSTGWSWPSCAFLITTQANSNLLKSGNAGSESFALRWTTDLPCQTRKTVNSYRFAPDRSLLHSKAQMSSSQIIRISYAISFSPCGYSRSGFSPQLLSGSHSKPRGFPGF